MMKRLTKNKYVVFPVVTVFCDHAFGALPEHIEIVALLSGKIYQFYPEEGDVSRSLKYLSSSCRQPSSCRPSLNKKAPVERRQQTRASHSDPIFLASHAYFFDHLFTSCYIVNQLTIN
ncbi:hypothetical protein [Caldalkalibacillus thermarum]|uniref:hypothetical protein n=1 Tax=Caldalkalibacillus thermarum TaxID=296745 RepID=UPI001E5A4368|nr:hypothetical protein [Caldalkalibacillus thermarum]